MKTINMLGIALAALALGACSDNIDYTPDEKDFPINSVADVTVSMEETAISVTENVGVFNVPIVVTGTPNGYVKVYVECIETGNDPAIPDADYFMSNFDHKGNTGYVRIDAESKVGSVEFRSVDRRGEDPTRTFIVRITSAEGAAVVAPNETLVSIVDKGPSPKYAELAGSWFMSGLRANADHSAIDDEYVQEVTILANDTNEKTVTVTGLTSINGDAYQLVLDWDYYEDEKWGQLVMPASALGGTYGPYQLKWENTDGVPLYGKWNSSYTSASFGNNDNVIYITAYSGDSAVGTLDIYAGFTLTRKQ